jgi:hypothetical protein
MLKTKRKRAVVLALIAFFCTGAATYVAVDWKRFGGGFLAFFKHDKRDPAMASRGGAPGSKADRMALGDTHASNGPALPALATASARRHTSGVTGGANRGKADDDLFKYGDPAAGGIPPGSFIVAQNDTPGGGGGNGGAGAPASVGVPGAPDTFGSPAPGGGGGVTSPAPAPAGTNGGSGDTGIVGTGKTPTPAPPAATPPAATPPAATPPAATPPAGSPPAGTPPAPAPSQSGTTDDPGTPVPPTDAPPPITSVPPVSSVPEASPLAMMSLGALFLAVAASRRGRPG